jgi:hypothetical protein
MVVKIPCFRYMSGCAVLAQSTACQECAIDLNVSAALQNKKPYLSSRNGRHVVTSQVNKPGSPALGNQQICHAHVSCEVKGESIRPQSMAEHNVVSVSAFSPWLCGTRCCGVQGRCGGKTSPKDKGASIFRCTFHPLPATATVVPFHSHLL